MRSILRDGRGDFHKGVDELGFNLEVWGSSSGEALAHGLAERVGVGGEIVVGIV